MVPLDEWVKWMVWARAMTEQFERERRELAAERLRAQFRVLVTPAITKNSDPQSQVREQTEGVHDGNN
jgi:hypothetical protein